MSREMELFSLPPEAVSASGPWLFWTREPDESFVRSLSQIGQIDPILICPDPEGWSLLTGYKRLMACLELGRRVWARQVRADPVSRGKISVWANRRRDVGPEDCLAPARYFQAVCGAAELRAVLSELFGDSLSERRLDDLLIWLRLPEDLDEPVRAGRLSLESGRILVQLRADELRALRPFFAELSWSRNRARQFLSWLVEASRRREEDIPALLARAGLEDILQADLSPKDCLQALLSSVRRLRYPFLTQLEDEFAGLRERVQRETLWRVQAEGGFETDTLFLSAQVANRSDLQRAARDLEKLVEHGRFEAFWSWQSERLDRGPGEPEPGQ